MKKIGIGVLGLLCFFFLTACGCSVENYTVTFDSNGGTSVSEQVVEKGGVVTRPTDPTRDGYTFDGWYVDVNSSVEYDFSQEVTSDMTLTAKWVLATVGDGGQTGEEDKTDKEEPKKCNLTCEDGYKLVDGDSENCKCEAVNVSVSSVKVSKSSLSLTVGGSATVTATVNPSNAKDKTVTWKSSNEKVATVKDGKITAVGAGTATITATAGGKSATVKVTVISKEQESLTKALSSIKAKTLTKGNTSINYTYSGCTITNTANVVSSGNSDGTVVSNGKVEKLYRASSSGNISSTYKVECGSLSETKTVKHTISASTYTYTAEINSATYTVLLKVSGVTDYTLSSSKASNIVYKASSGGATTSLAVHESGLLYKMVLNSDANTIYAVKYAG